jgi:hypothetical protein
VPQRGGFHITIDAVYESESTGLIVEAPYSLYSKLNFIPGIQLIFENTHGNLDPGASKRQHNNMYIRDSSPSILTRIMGTVINEIQKKEKKKKLVESCGNILHKIVTACWAGHFPVLSGVRRKVHI